MIGLKDSVKSGEGSPQTVTIYQQGVPRTLIPLISSQTGRPIQICAQPNAGRSRLHVPILPRPVPISETTPGQLQKLNTSQQIVTTISSTPVQSEHKEIKLDRPPRDAIESPPELDRIEPQGENDAKSVDVEEDFHDMLEKSMKEERERFNEQKSNSMGEGVFIDFDGIRIEELEQEELEIKLEESSLLRKVIEENDKISNTSEKDIDEQTKKKKDPKKSQDKSEAKLSRKVTALLTEASEQIAMEENEQEGTRKRKRPQEIVKGEMKQEKKGNVSKRGRHLKRDNRENHERKTETPDKDSKDQGEISSNESVEKSKKAKRCRTSEIDKLLGMDFGPKEGGTLKDLEHGKNGRLSLTPRRASLPEKKLISPVSNRRETPVVERRSSRRKISTRNYLSPDEDKYDNKDQTSSEEKIVIKNKTEINESPKQIKETLESPKKTPESKFILKKEEEMESDELNNPKNSDYPAPVSTKTINNVANSGSIEAETLSSKTGGTSQEDGMPTEKIYLPTGGTLNYKNWTIDQLADWVENVTGSATSAEKFRLEEMDGSTLDFVTTDDIRNQLKIPFGSALKLKNAISHLREEYSKHFV